MSNPLSPIDEGWTDGAGWHGHRFTTNGAVYQGGQASNIYTSPTAWTPPGHNHDGYTDGEGNHAHNVATNPSLGSTNNMPPYISVNYLVHI